MAERIDRSRRDFLHAGLVGGLGLALPAGLLRKARADFGDSRKPPNVVIILIDDMGWTDLGCFGSTYYETPHIDRLCKQGMKFTQGYAACAVCSPTRASVMTGRYPPRVGIMDWIRPLAGQEWTEEQIRAGAEYVGGTKRPLLTPANPRWMEHDEFTIAELLKQRGYATGFVGKWHLGPEKWWPESQGFDFNAGGCDYGHPPHYFDPYPAKHQKTTIPNLPPRKEGEYLTDREADEAVGFIEQHHAQPFLLCMAHYAVHSPIQAKQDLVEKYEAKEKTNQKYPKYAAMVESVDDAVGRIVSTLMKHDLLDNTLIIFTSDNGGASHFEATDNAPLRKGKGFPYEGGIRVPFIAHWPAVIKPGTVTDQPVCTIDIFPTLAAATGTAEPGARKIDGLSLMPLFTKKGALKRDTLIWHFPHYWGGKRVKPYSIIREGDWKLIYHYESSAYELYNLKDDIGEQTNLVEKMPAKVRELKEKLDAALKEQGAKFPKKNPDYRPE